MPIHQVANNDPTHITFMKTAVKSTIFRDTANELIRELCDLIIFGTRKKDAASQRRILRSYGAEYRYLPGEVVDEGGGVG